MEKRNPGVAAVLSFFFFGLGQLYCGAFGRFFLWFFGAPLAGVLVWVLAVAGVAASAQANSEAGVVASLSGGLILAALVPFVLWITNIFDAYSLAESMNARLEMAARSRSRTRERRYRRRADERPSESSQEIDALEVRIAELERLKSLKEKKRGLEQELVTGGVEGDGEELRRAMEEYDRRIASRDGEAVGGEVENHAGPPTKSMERRRRTTSAGRRPTPSNTALLVAIPAALVFAMLLAFIVARSSRPAQPSAAAAPRVAPGAGASLGERQAEIERWKREQERRLSEERAADPEMERWRAARDAQERRLLLEQRKQREAREADERQRAELEKLAREREGAKKQREWADAAERARKRNVFEERVEALMTRHLPHFSRIGSKPSIKASYRSIKDACDRVCRRMAEREARGEIMGDVTDQLVFEELAISIDKFGE